MSPLVLGAQLASSLSLLPSLSAAQDDEALPTASWPLFGMDHYLTSGHRASIVLGVIAGTVLVLFFGDKAEFFRRTRAIFGLGPGAGAGGSGAAGAVGASGAAGAAARATPSPSKRRPVGDGDSDDTESDYPGERKRRPVDVVRDSDSQVADDEDELTGTDATPAGTPSARRRPGREFGDGRGRGGQLSRRQRKNRKQLAEGRAAGEQGASSTAGTAAVAAAGSGTTVHINGNGKSKKKSQSLPLYTALNISDEKIYEALERYSLTQMALQKFGFPVESEERPGLVCIIVNQSSGGGGGGARGGGGNNGRNNEDVPSEADEQEADRVLNPNAREFRPRSQPQSPRMPKRGVNGEEGASETKSELYSPPTLKTSSSSQTLSPTAEEFVPKSARCMSRPQHFHQESPTGGGNDVFRTPLSRRGNAGNGEASMRRVASEPVKMDSEMASASKPKLCMRCSRHFHVEDGVYLQREKCVYHWAKAKMKRHQCCGRPRGALGCQEAEVHVWKGLDAVDRQYLDNFVVTKLPRRALSSNYGSTFFPGVFAMDAEMAFTAYGLELIRLTVVGLDGRLVYEAYVRPEHHIVDYNTRYSGLSARELDRLANKTLKQVQNDLMGFLSARSILIGHGLENDLRVLRLVHTTVIDTSIVFMEEGGSSMRPSLKHLAKVRLDKNIQTSDYGHDSKEDAVTCMELMLLKVGEDLRRGGIICP